jgi:type I restriction enzyme S subunit
MACEASTDDVIDLPFDVPEGWRTARLSTHCEFVRDGDWIESKDQGGDDYRLLQISNIGVGRFVETGNYRWITQETFERLGCTEILSGDVLVARMPDPTGRAWCVSALPWKSVTAVDVAIIRTKSCELDPRFLGYFLNSPACLGVVQGLTTGTTRLRIRRADIQRLQVPLPEPNEQRAIAHILGTLDDKIELNRRMDETLESMARALFKSWFVDFDPVRAKAEGRDPGLPQSLAGLFPDSFEDSELGELPARWSAMPLYDIATYINGAAYSAFQPNDERRGLPIIKIAELKAGVTAQTKFSDVQMPEKYRIAKGDILFSWSGNPDTSIDTFVWSDGAGSISTSFACCRAMRRSARSCCRP